MDPSHRSHSVLGTQPISVLARLLELVARLDEITAGVETLHAHFPVGSFELKPQLDRRKAELLSEIDRAKGQAVRAVISTLTQHEQTKQGGNDEH